MHTIAVISQKGGAGKTTMTVSLAATAAREFVTLILDTDPQATASSWSAWRGGRDPEVIDCGAPSLLAGKLKRSAELGAELALIDTPPHADAMARQAAILADLILIPCRPRAFDLAALEATGDLVRSIRKPAFVVFNAGPPRAPRVYEEAAEVIGGFGLQMAPVSLAERAAFHHATAAGVSAPELAANSRASAELAALWRWTRTQLNTSTRRQETLAGSAQ